MQEHSAVPLELVLALKSRILLVPAILLCILVHPLSFCDRVYQLAPQRYALTADGIQENVPPSGNIARTAHHG